MKSYFFIFQCFILFSFIINQDNNSNNEIDEEDYDLINTINQILVFLKLDKKKEFSKDEYKTILTKFFFGLNGDDEEKINDSDFDNDDYNYTKVINKIIKLLLDDFNNSISKKEIYDTLDESTLSQITHEAISHELDDIMNLNEINDNDDDDDGDDDDE